MEIFMDHPHNGARVAYSLAEAATWEAKGWKIRQDETKPAEIISEIEANSAADAAADAAVDAPKKRGRKAKS